MELTNPITARIRIREFSRELQGRCGVDARVLEKDIIRAKRLNHIALEEYEWVGYYARTEEQKRSISTLWTRAELRKKYTAPTILKDKLIAAQNKPPTVPKEKLMSKGRKARIAAGRIAMKAENEKTIVDN